MVTHTIPSSRPAMRLYPRRRDRAERKEKRPLARRAGIKASATLKNEEKSGNANLPIGVPGQEGKEKGPKPEFGAFWNLSRRRPTFPHSYPCSIIGPARLNFRVRDGNGCDPRGMTTGNLVKSFALGDQISDIRKQERRRFESFRKRLARRHWGAADNSLGWRIQVRPAAEQLLCATRRCRVV